MTDGKLIQMEAPETKDLPQGADAFLAAHRALHEALFELHAPFLDRHQGLQQNYYEVQRAARMIGFFVNDSITIIMNPELFKAPQEEADDAE